MAIFYVTFGQKSPFRDNWMEIEAPDIHVAKEIIRRDIGWENFSMIYTEENWKPEYFPGGRIKTRKPE